MRNMTKPAMPRLLLTEIELCAWLGQAGRGAVLEYHRGRLVVDVDARSSSLNEHDRSELVRVGRRAYWAAERGVVYLVQRRHGPDDCSYLIIARPRPADATTSFATLLDEEVA